MTGVRYSGPCNSTLFTTCCGVAVCDDQASCPACGEEVYPSNPRSRHSNALRDQMGEGAYAEHRKHVDEQIRRDKVLDLKRQSKH